MTYFFNLTFSNNHPTIKTSKPALINESDA